jgi:hypothetical protein
MSLEEEVRRGQRAESLLQEPILLEAFEEVEKVYHKEWENAPARDVEGRERLWLMLRLLKLVRGHLEEAAKTGHLAARQLTQLRDEQKKKRFHIL